MSEPIHVLDRRVVLHQHADGFRTSIDAVLLAAACPIKSGQRVLDLGCGVGSATFCVLKRVEGSSAVGIDIQDEVITLARQNAAANDMEARCSFEQTDIRDFQRLEFDHVICNPPYLEAGDHVPSPTKGKATAMGFIEPDMDLNPWVACAFNCLKGTGSFSLIHRADQIDDILRAFGKRFGAIEIFPLWPKAGQPAKRVIIRARKHRQSPAVLHAGLVLHEEGGGYTAAAEKVLRGMSAIA